MGSRSSASTATSQTTNQTSRNLNLQDTEGVTVGEAGGDVTIVSTDHNAFDRASDLARQSIEVAESISRSGLELSLQQTREISDLSRSAIDEVSTSAGSFYDKAISFAKDITQRSGDTLADTVEALNAISVEQNKSTDQRVAEISQNAIRYTLIAVGIITVGVLGFAVFGRGGK